MGDTKGVGENAALALRSTWPLTEVVRALRALIPKRSQKMVPERPQGRKTVEKSANLSGTSVWRPKSRYTVSRIECRIKFPQNQRCRAKIALHPPKSRCRTFLRTPPVALSSHSQQARGAAGWWRVSRHFWVLKNGSRYRGVSQLQSHQSRYSVQLSGKP